MYGDLSREISESEIIEAAKSANIHDFIDGLPEVSRKIVRQHDNIWPNKKVNQDLYDIQFQIPWPRHRKIQNFQPTILNSYYVTK